MNFPQIWGNSINVLTFGGGLDIIYRHKNANDPLAQPVEHLTFNQRARGSSPRRVTKETGIPLRDACFFLAPLTWTEPPKMRSIFTGFAPAETTISTDLAQNRGSESPTGWGLSQMWIGIYTF